MTEEPKWTAWKAYLKLLETETYQDGGVGRQAFREEIERGSLIGYAQLGFTPSTEDFPGINSLFTGKLNTVHPNIITPIDLSLYWDENGLVKPSDYTIISAYSRRAFKYGQISTDLILPDLSNYPPPPSPVTYFSGFGRGDSPHSGVASWAQVANTVQIVVWSGRGGRQIDVTSLMPTDYLTIKYWYLVKVNKNCVEFYMGSETTNLKLIAVIVTAGIGSGYTLNGPPYAIGVAPTDLPISMNTLNEISYTVPKPTTQIILPLSPRWLRANDGDPRPPRVYRLYDAGTETLFTSLTIAAGSETSHPFPLFGYEGKTIYFQANQAGNFDIEILDQTGNWRAHSTVAFLVNTLSVTTIADEAVIGRIVVTPTAFPCVISTAEVVLR